MPHKDFSDLYEKMSGKAASATEAHRRGRCSMPLASSCDKGSSVSYHYGEVSVQESGKCGVRRS